MSRDYFIKGRKPKIEEVKEILWDFSFNTDDKEEYSSKSDNHTVWIATKENDDTFFSNEKTTTRIFIVEIHYVRYSRVESFWAWGTSNETKLYNVLLERGYQFR